MSTSTIAHCTSAWDHQRPPTNRGKASVHDLSLSLLHTTRFISSLLASPPFLPAETRESLSSSKKNFIFSREGEFYIFLFTFLLLEKVLLIFEDTIVAFSFRIDQKDTINRVVRIP